MSEIHEEAIIEDIKAVASRLRQTSLSRSQYLNNGGRYSEYDLYDGGRTWGTLCNAAGVATREKQLVPDEVYFQRLRDACAVLGRHPKTSERKKFSLNFRKSRWPTLNAFIGDAIEKGEIPAPPTTTLPQLEPALHEDGEEKLTAAVPQPLAGALAARPVPPIPSRTKRRNWERTGVGGFPYAPQNEQGVVVLLGILCQQRRIPWEILDLNVGKGIDATCYDHDHHREFRVEFKRILSQSSWNHPLEELDYLVCWENRWPTFPKPVIELRKLVRASANSPGSGPGED